MKSILTLSHYVRVLLTVVGLMASVISLALSNNAAAAGVALGATRVIYPQDAKQASINVTNSDLRLC